MRPTVLALTSAVKKLALFEVPGRQEGAATLQAVRFLRVLVCTASRPRSITPETFAAVPWIIRNGGAAYLECGKPNNGGTKIFSGLGDVENARKLQVPLGTTLLPSCWSWRVVFAKVVKLKAVIPGGSSSPVLPASIIMECTMEL